MSILVRNNTRRLMGFGGARIEPGATEECNAKKADAQRHPFFTTGQLSIESKGGGGGKKQQPANPAGGGGDNPQGDQSEDELVTDIAAMDDMDRLRELSEDERQSVSDAAVTRILELEGQGGE